MAIDSGIVSCVKACDSGLEFEVKWGVLESSTIFLPKVCMYVAYLTVNDPCMHFVL